MAKRKNNNNKRIVNMTVFSSDGTVKEVPYIRLCHIDDKVKETEGAVLFRFRVDFTIIDRQPFEAFFPKSCIYIDCNTNCVYVPLYIARDHGIGWYVDDAKKHGMVSYADYKVQNTNSTEHYNSDNAHSTYSNSENNVECYYDSADYYYDPIQQIIKKVW